MLHLVAVMLPLGLASAVSPVMLTEQTVLLSGPRGRRRALLFAAGTATVLVVLVSAVLLAGRGLSLPTSLHLNATLDVVLGVALLVLALVMHVARRREPRQQGRPLSALSPPAAYTFGLFAMATNVTTLALVVPAAREIAATDVAVWGHLVAAAILVSFACLPAWGPVVLESAAPRTAASLLAKVNEVVRRHGRLLVVLLIAAVGAYLLARGLVRLAGL